MSADSLVPLIPPAVLVHLLDPNVGRPVQSWRFAAKPSLSIGRGDDRDVALSDPYVSRNHAELQYRDGGWVLVSHGRNGVLVSNKLITEYAVESEVSFRLGAKGPTLRFQPADIVQEAPATLQFDSRETFAFRLDEDRLQRDVEEIAEGDYFQNLRRKAAELRQRRQ
jgi:pSer/pThr/pTyr-binding forkhead associated (FHA) protein